jgi:prophage antirepressor-like protein
MATAIAPAITAFEFHDNRVRVEIVDGVEFFVAVDVAAILGYKNARQAVRSHVSKQDRKGVQVLDTPGGRQTLLGVNESGLYALIMGSKKPEARIFKQWVTSEVLPALRKTGHYEVGSRFPALPRQIAAALRGRGRAKAHQLNRVLAHRDGTFSIRIGRYWMRRIPSLGNDLPASHALREGLALGAFRFSQALNKFQ